MSKSTTRPLNTTENTCPIERIEPTVSLKKALHVAILASLTLAGILAPATGMAETAFLAGAAKTDITPPIGFPMWGYGARHDMPSAGVLDPLQTRALVLAVGNEKLALVGLDLGRAPTRQSMARIRAEVKKRTGIEH